VRETAKTAIAGLLGDDEVAPLLDTTLRQVQPFTDMSATDNA
jgi:hypothetical protein